VKGIAREAELNLKLQLNHMMIKLIPVGTCVGAKGSRINGVVMN
jgi:transcription antitermination factor NusA-like protein